ncbi:ice-structuring glycoprotein-like isoform X2 [Trichoplusia ni]|uniref:Ice-structuring glycoprotein-like isoform X2 n=1 Tax=Trichoplusia ni TaxID=7111 RepID=A0A7E5X250_TRINI|nr:ice-structuring glycoprotein-like isoform X2 [Trichoplusia ni]
MFEFRILLCSLLIISCTIAENVPPPHVESPPEAEKLSMPKVQWDNILKEAKEVCKCTTKPIEIITPAPSPNPCEAKATNVFFELNSTELAPLDNLCKSIRDANFIVTAIKPAQNPPAAAASTNTKEIVSPSTAAPTSSTSGAGSIATEASTNTSGTAKPATAASTDSSGAVKPATAESTNTSGTVKPATLAPTNTSGAATPATATPTNTSAAATPATVATTNTTGAETAATVAITNTTGTVPPATATSTNTSGIITPATAAPTNTSGAAAPVTTTPKPPVAENLPPSSKTKQSFSLKEILLTFFGAFGAGILIAVAAKIVHTKYRSRTYGGRNAA